MAASVFGRTAVHARSLRAQARRRLLLFSGWALLLSGASLGVLASSLPFRLFVSAALLLATIAALALARSAAQDAARTSAGIGAEEAVARALERLPVAAVSHNVLLGRGDVDHVVLGPVCWAVETKYGRGRVDASPGRVRVAGKAIPRDPLAQARQAASALSRWCGFPAVPVLVVSQGDVDLQCVDGVWICAPSQLAGLLARSPAGALSTARALSLAARLPVAQS